MRALALRRPQDWLGTVLWVLVWGAAVACSGCGHSPNRFHATDVRGVLPALEFSLADADGNVTAADFRGKTTLLYFGYTSCPDVCPTTLSKLSQSLRRLGPRAKAVRVLFVSVDPKRDTPKVLARYAAAFGPEVIGLTGNDDQLIDVTKRFRVAYRLDSPDADGNYAVYHSSAVFVFDGTGRARLLINESETSDQLAQDLRALVS